MKAYLIFQDGTVFEGERIGATSCGIGEAVFNTVMNGFVETLTDPAAFGAIVVQTFPMLGNYGAMEADAESGITAAGLVVRELCDKGSNFRKDCELDAFLKERGIPGISGVDTREITKKIRDGGATNAMISESLSDLPNKLKALSSYKRENCLKACAQPMSRIGKGKRVVLWDLGAKNSLVSALVDLGCEVVRVPFDIAAAQILELKPQGIIVAGGGSPEGTKDIVSQISLLADSNIPMLGVGLGHSLICLSIGGKIKKLKLGHRGGNQPVKDLSDGRVYITAQNHGYVVVNSSISERARVSFVNLNDKTCEGLVYNDINVQSVQFEPTFSAAFILENFAKQL